MPHNYHTISFPEIKADLAAATREVERAFGSLRIDQLNWKPNVEQWSVAQCLEHLTINNQIFAPLYDEVINQTKRPTFWESVPLVPRFGGWLLIKVLTSPQKYKAPPTAQPDVSKLDAEVVHRFLNEQQALLKRLEAISGFALEKIIVTSPFIKAITYNLLDVCRFTAAHVRRHFAQAQLVTQTPGFPQ